MRADLMMLVAGIVLALSRIVAARSRGRDLQDWPLHCLALRSSWSPLAISRTHAVRVPSGARKLRGERIRRVEEVWNRSG